MSELIKLLSNLDQDIRRRGFEFERICKWYLENEPRYKFKLKKVWLWDEWPDRWGIDAGIDLIALDENGQYWAIQAKAYSETTRITKADVDTFLSESSRKKISFRLLIATTNLIGTTAYRTLAAQEKPVHLMLLHDLEESNINWPESPSLFKTEVAPKKSPRKHQLEAIDNVCVGFKSYDRGQLILACGTGKTLTSLWIAEKNKAQNVLVLVPSLSLLKQTLSEWSHNCSLPFRYLAVCSDESVAIKKQDTAIQSSIEMGVPVTTNIDEISSFLTDSHQDIPSYIFSTYQSSDRIALAQEGKPHRFDLIIADEAHRCAGSVDSMFATVLNNTKIRSAKRLFMTATPRYFTGRVVSRASDADFEIASMDNESIFGPVLHKLIFGEAIKRDLLTDYQVVVIGVTADETKKMIDEGLLVQTKSGVQTDARTLAAQIGLAKAIKKYDLGKIITFHSSLKKASRFTSSGVNDSLSGVISVMSKMSKPSGDLWTKHISGKMPAGKRAHLLKALGQLEEGTIGVISNCSCLSEGVDVPTLDGIAFIDPKSSMIDIIQAVGRVIRKAEDKNIGTVVVPVLLGEGDDPDNVLNKSAFQPVWQVLKALKAHDDSLADELDMLRYKLGRNFFKGKKIALPSKMKFDLHSVLLEDFEQSLFVKIVQNTTEKPPLTIKEILKWADLHFERTGQWPKSNSGSVHEASEETWTAITIALSRGTRGLPGGSSLPKLLEEHRGVINRMNQPNLVVDQILEWADLHFERTGQWPKSNSGSVHEAPEVTWLAITHALIKGSRGLPGGSSLAKLLEEHRGVINEKNLPDLHVDQILKWADSYFKRTGKWPRAKSGQVNEAPQENWSAINQSLQKGYRGLPEGSSLPKLLEEHREVTNIRNPADLAVKQILEWADLHFKRTGKWPKRNSGSVLEAPEVTWSAIGQSLVRGSRGLPGGSSLPKLLEEHRGVINEKNLPDLHVDQILKWADSYFKRTGKWPRAKSGQVNEAPQATWTAINHSLSRDTRGLQRGSSLSRLLEEYRGVINQQNRSHLVMDQIFEWADLHFERTGQWPKSNSGSVHEAPEEKWSAINGALSRGTRGLPGGSSLPKLLEEHRGVINEKNRPKLTINMILEWADLHFKRTGKWPKEKPGSIHEAPEEKWSAISGALFKGSRGLPGGSSLARLLAEHRGVINEKNRPDLAVDQILEWADLHFERTGKWPNYSSGTVQEAPEEKWSAINGALSKGSRGLPGGSSLAKLFKEFRGVLNIQNRPNLVVNRILEWADLHFERTGKWPKRNSGSVLEASEEKWSAINTTLINGYRGLPGGSSLARLLAEHRGVINIKGQADLHVEQILKWADSHYKRTGGWPIIKSGPVYDAPQEKWSAIHTALAKGLRGLPGGSSLHRILKKSRAF